MNGYDTLWEDAEQETLIALWLVGNATPSSAAVRKGTRRRVLEMLRGEWRRTAAEAEHAYVTHDLRVRFVDTRRQWNKDRTKDYRRAEARKRRSTPEGRAKANAYNAAYRQRQREARAA